MHDPNDHVHSVIEDMLLTEEEIGVAHEVWRKNKYYSSFHHIKNFQRYLLFTQINKVLESLPPRKFQRSKKSL